MNTLYLKVGVALTAAFAFGYLVGTEFAIRKMREMMGEKAEDFELMKQELAYQAEMRDTVPVEPEEPQQEEENDMAKRRSTVTESFHYDIPYELVIDEFGTTLGTSAEEWAKSASVAADRIVRANELFAEAEDVQMTEAIAAIQRRNTPMEIRDTTVYDTNKTMRNFRLVYIRNASRLYWRIGDWRPRIAHEEICDILVRLMTFSVTREKGDGTIIPTTWTPALLMSEEGILPEDDPELYNTRIFLLEDLGIEVEILIEPTEPYPGRVEALLEAHWEE